MTIDHLKKLNECISGSFFRKSSSYNVNCSPKKMFTDDGSFISYNNKAIVAYEQGEKDPETLLEMMTPAFQRENNKWSVDMQRCFVENMLCGAKTTIQLFEVKVKNVGEFGRCGVLDGLQRTTAIVDFQKGRFDIFDGISWDGLMKSKGVFPRCRLEVSIYQFVNVKEAVEFYIQINKGITHSPEDLVSAYKYLESLDGTEMDW